MRVFVSVKNKTTHEYKEIEHYLGLKILHEGKEYTLSTDNYNCLVIRSTNSPQLIIVPKASNSIEIKSE
jgi:hypothetical protein